ncbi:MAG: DUF1553 domain-containing protein [Planctomycetes bacterium]|nr:DUF1553 domain-containing protein [Planctomycetota bacterium]
MTFARCTALACAFAFSLFAFVSVAVADETAPVKPGAKPESDPSASSGQDLTALIDAEIEKVLKREGVAPARLCSDEEFIRRAYLQIIGLLPTYAEAEAFLKDTGKSKRDALIDRLIADKRFGEHLADLWTTVLVGRGKGMGAAGGNAANLFAIWLSERFNKNDSFGDIAYDMLTARGKLSENPALALYLSQGPDFRAVDFAGNISRNLTGVQIQCAQCHKHPYEKWTEADFGGVASFFAPVQLRINFQALPPDPTVEDQKELPRRLIEGIKNREKLPPEARGKIEELLKYNSPKLPGGDAVATTDRSLWRAIYAKWLISKDNNQTRRYFVNRFWSFAFGRAILEPVDDFNSLSKPSHPELMDALAADFAASNYDVKRLYRAMFKTRAWQRSSTREPESKAEPWMFAHYPVRQLTAEQFFGAIVAIAGGDAALQPFRAYIRDNYDFVRKQIERMKDGKEPKGENDRPKTPDTDALDRYEAQAAKMSDSWSARRRMAMQFVGQSTDDEMTEADGFSLSIDQALAVMNGNITNRLSGSGRGTVLGDLAEKFKDSGERLRVLYLMVLTREPGKDESRRMLEFLAAGKNSPKAWEDVLFALLMTTEFATDH